MRHRLALRVYYEDTDAGGVVYYANYLKFLERGRTEFLRALGVEQRQLAADTGLGFVVRAISAEYLQPARLDDELVVMTAIAALGRAQVKFAQSIQRANTDTNAASNTLLLTATVRVACLDLAKSRAAAMPKTLHSQLAALPLPIELT